MPIFASLLVSLHLEWVLRLSGSPGSCGVSGGGLRPRIVDGEYDVGRFTFDNDIRGTGL